MITEAFNTKLTVYHQDKKTDDNTQKNKVLWERYVLKDCYFATVQAKTVNDITLSQSGSYIARIPYKYDDFKIEPGDIIVKSEVSDEIKDVMGHRISDLISKYKPDCFTVTAFSDNTKIPEGAHYKVTGV